MKSDSPSFVPVGRCCALASAVALCAMLASAAAGAETTGGTRSERAGGDLWRVARQLPDPETFIWRLRQDKPLTTDEQAYLERFRREQGLERREVADHLERLLGETRFRDYAESQTNGTKPGGHGTSSRPESEAIYTGSFAILVAVAVVIVLFDLLLLRARQWRRLQEAGGVSADQLLQQAGKGGRRPDESAAGTSTPRSADPPHTD